MIKGENIYLRPIEKIDIKELNKWKNDEEIFMNLGGGFMPTSIDQQEKWLDSMIDNSGSNKRFIVCDGESVAIGMVGLYNIHHIHRNCEIGTYIGSKTSQGKGYGKEATLLLEKFAKEYLNLRKIKLTVVADNIAGFYMWEALGYIKVGEYKKERYIKGNYKDLILMEKFL